MTRRHLDPASPPDEKLLAAFKELPDAPMDAEAKQRVLALLLDAEGRGTSSAGGTGGHPRAGSHSAGDGSALDVSARSNSAGDGSGVDVFARSNSAAGGSAGERPPRRDRPARRIARQRHPALGSALAALAGVAIVVAGIVGIDRYISTGHTSVGHHKAAAVYFTSYHNARFGYTVDLPSSWPRQVSADGSGVTLIHPTADKAFVNPNPPANDAVLTVKGIPNATMGSAAGQSFAQMWSEIQGIVKGLQGSPGVLTAKCGRANGSVWMITVRKVGHDATEYDKAYFTLSSVKAVQLVYPTDQKARYEPVIRRVTQSFILGGESG